MHVTNTRLHTHTHTHRKADVERMLYELYAPVPIIYEDVFVFVDPAAGGPGSDYGIMSVTRSRGILAVSFSCLASTDEILLLDHLH